MDITCSKLIDLDLWIDLAREVEPLFGPMADDVGFKGALTQAISSNTAFCIYADSHENITELIGGIIISKESNEIAWFAVSKPYRGKGYGRKLLEFALSKLNPLKTIFVQTFDDSLPEGKAARSLYMDLGFVDAKEGELNPAGVSTIIMQLEVKTIAQPAH